jgi:integrase
MAHIERRVRNGKTTYRARYRDPAGREHAKMFARKADAQRFLTEMENSKLKGAWTDPALGRVLFREWFAEWQRTTARLRPNTEARDERLFRPMPLARIGQRDVRAWVAGLTTKGLAASTVQRCYQLLSKVMAAAVDAGMIPQTPCRRVPLPRIERKEMRFLSPAEVWKLADAIGPDYRALILLGALGGLRIGEMAGLRRGRVDLERGTVQVIEVITEPKDRLHFGPPKTSAGRRMVGLPRFVADALAERMAGPGSPEELVFAGPQGDAVPAPLLATGDRGGRPGGAAHPRPAAHSGRLVDRRRRQTQGGRGPGRPCLGELHPGPLRPPVPGGGPDPARALGRDLVGERRRIVSARGPSAAPATAERRCGPVVTRIRRFDLRRSVVGVTGLEPVTSSL